jgi:hypothetical protein
VILVATWTAPQTAAVIVGVAAAVVALIGVWINGLRQERHRRRELYADALEATYAYREFAYVVRRRRSDVPGEERVRISESLREIQRDLAKYEALMKIERCTNVAVNYRHLVDKTREVAGGYMRASWNGDGAAEDKQMNIADIDFAPLEEYEIAYLGAVADDLPAWKFWR